MYILPYGILAVSLVHASLNGPCSVDGTAGVCVATATCEKGGGLTDISGCEGDPIDIQCCIKPTCAPTAGCLWRADCPGSVVGDLCPGPRDFKCCFPTSGIVTIPSARCKPHVLDHGYEIQLQFPNQFVATWCANPPDTGHEDDHRTGTAIDFMLPRPFLPIGQTVAEWVMDNAAALEVKYVIWGAKIWHASIDRDPKPWAQWRPNPGSPPDNVTANHWDHPHVSFYDRPATIVSNQEL